MEPSFCGTADPNPKGINTTEPLGKTQQTGRGAGFCLWVGSLAPGAGTAGDLTLAPLASMLELPGPTGLDTLPGSPALSVAGCVSLLLSRFLKNMWERGGDGRALNCQSLSKSAQCDVFSPSVSISWLMTKGKRKITSTALMPCSLKQGKEKHQHCNRPHKATLKSIKVLVQHSSEVIRVAH